MIRKGKPQCIPNRSVYRGDCSEVAGGDDETIGVGMAADVTKNGSTHLGIQRLNRG